MSKIRVKKLMVLDDHLPGHLCMYLYDHLPLIGGAVNHFILDQKESKQETRSPWW